MKNAIPLISQSKNVFCVNLPLSSNVHLNACLKSGLICNTERDTERELLSWYLKKTNNVHSFKPMDETAMCLVRVLPAAQLYWGMLNNVSTWDVLIYSAAVELGYIPIPIQTPQATKFSFKIHTGAAIFPLRQINPMFYNCCKLIKANPLDEAEVCNSYSVGSTGTLTHTRTAWIVWVEILQSLMDSVSPIILNIRGYIFLFCGPYEELWIFWRSLSLR